jgi:hypothetical protein
MKERPILFSGPMVKAILGGSKTQTRRVAKPPRGPIDPPKGWYLAHYQNSGEWSTWANETACGTLRIYNPHGKIGDRLWVKETFLNNALDGYKPVYFYRADDDDKPEDRNWRPSIFMPRSAARITLEITGVRVERLQEISEADAMAEGVDWKDYAGLASKTAKKLYAQLWDSINGKKHPWSSNPWVWVISFAKL